MRRLRLFGVCAITAFAITAIGASAASATAPEYGRCIKQTANAKKEYAGNFSDSKCTKKVTEIEKAKKGKYEWFPGAVKTKFTTSGGAGVLTTVGGALVECKAQTSTGELVPGNNKEEKGIVVIFTGCKALGLPCTSPGAKEGELITNELEGLVGWTSKSAKKTALELFPAKSVVSGQFIEFTCTGLVVKVRGKVLVPIKNDKMTTTETLKFKATKGKQKPETWEEAAGPQILEASFSNIGAGAYEQAGQTITSTIKGEEALELNAVV